MLGSRVRVRSDTLSDAGKRKTFWIEQRSVGRNDGVQHGKNDGTQPMNGSSTGEEILDKHPCKSSRYPASLSSAATICCADRKSSIAGCNIIDGKHFIEACCKTSKREITFGMKSHNFSEISSKFVDPDKVLCGGMEDFNDDERAKKLAKLDTGLCEGMINRSQSNLGSAKEKHNDGDDGFKFLNHNAICSKMKDKGDSNMREEHGHRRNEALALLPESEYPYGKPLHEELGNYKSQCPECSMQEEDHIDEHIDYRRIFSQHMEIKGKKHSPQSMPALSVTNMLRACRSIHEYQRVSKISEGVYGVVFKAQDKKTGEIVAIKKVKMEREKDGFPITSLREINILLSMDHPSIVVVKEIAVDDDLEGVYMVMEHMEQDLAGLLETHNGSFSQGEVKFMMLQLLEGVEYIHSKWVLHRDLKPSNLLVDQKGMLKICDFGLARQYGSPLKTYTHKVVSLRYRDPMLLLGSCKYSTAVDMWSLGCIMAELLGKVPLFKGCSELDQLKKIVAILGSPDETVLQNKLSGVQFNFLREPSKGILREIFPPTSFTGKTPLSEKGFNLLSRLLNYDAHKRITAEDAVRHDWFREDPLPKPLNLPAY